MSESNPASTSRRSQQQFSNPDELIAQLTNLMPVLQRIQAQAWTQPPPAMPGFFNPQAAMTDQLAATQFAEDLTATVLRSIAGYVQANIEKNAGLQNCLGIVIEGARYFGTRDFAHAFDCAWQAYRAIAHMRSTDPQLPPLHFTDTGHEGGSAGTSIH